MATDEPRLAGFIDVARRFAIIVATDRANPPNIVWGQYCSGVSVCVGVVFRRTTGRPLLAPSNQLMLAKNFFGKRFGIRGKIVTIFTSYFFVAISLVRP